MRVVVGGFAQMSHVVIRKSLYHSRDLRGLYVCVVLCFPGYSTGIAKQWDSQSIPYSQGVPYDVHVGGVVGVVVVFVEWSVCVC